MNMKFHHIGIACNDIEEMKQYLRQLFEVENESETLFDELQEANLCMVTLKDGIQIELVSGKVVETIVKKRQFLYHICYTTNNLEGKIEEFKALGAMIVSEPKQAILFGGRRVSFLMTALGLVELLESEVERRNDLLYEFIQEVSDKNELQKKYLENWEASVEEKEELSTILQFFMKELRYDLDFIVESYLFINDMVAEETYYFVRNGKYRNSSFEEVNAIVYDNPDYMEKYMIGLSISDYIWINHIKMLRFFSDSLPQLGKGAYLEIGPGFGQYLVKAILSENFEKYKACDISKTSVNRSNKYLKYRGLEKYCVVEEMDFFQYNTDERFDCIVSGEVLEHIEQPLQMLKKIHELLTENGKAFVTTVINAPAIDHISLFKDIEQILDLAKEAGFKIADYLCVTEGDVPLDKAVKKKRAIDIAMILEK